MSQSPHIFVMRLGRFFVVLFALIGLFGQSVTAAMAMPQRSSHAVTTMAMAPADCAQMATTPHLPGDQSPCEKECLAKMGCGAASIMASRLPVLVLTEDYQDTAYFTAGSHLSGVEVEPEIFPPIA